MLPVEGGPPSNISPQRFVAGGSAVAGAKIPLAFSGTTDPGGPNKENQDEFFTWEHPEGREKGYYVCACDQNALDNLHLGSVVLAVFDGHGREVGKLAASTAKQSMQQQLMQPNLFSMIGEDPKAAMDGMFEAAHQSIKIVRPRYVVRVALRH